MKDEKILKKSETNNEKGIYGYLTHLFIKIKNQNRQWGFEFCKYKQSRFHTTIGDLWSHIVPICRPGFRSTSSIIVSNFSLKDEVLPIRDLFLNAKLLLF